MEQPIAAGSLAAGSSNASGGSPAIGSTNVVRKAGTQPIWCPDDVWKAWTRKWSSPEFKRKCETAKKARGGKDGVPKGTHTRGSCSAAKTAEKLAPKRKQPEAYDIAAIKFRGGIL